MPRKPDQTVLEAAKKKLDPKAILNATINEMHNDELEAALVEAGVAVYVQDGEEND